MSTVGPVSAQVDRRQRQRAIPQHGHFAGDAQVPQAVGAVARDFQIDGQVAADVVGFFMVQPGQHQPVAQAR